MPLGLQVASQLNTGEDALDPDGPISDRPMSNLEKVHFIVAYAILKPDLRSVPMVTACLHPRNLSSTHCPPWAID